MGWVAWSLVAVLGWGVWAVLNKLALRTLAWTHLLAASWLVTTVAVVALLLTRTDPRALASRDGLLALAASVMSLAAVVAFYQAIRSGPVATVTPLSSLYPAVTAIVAALLLHENPSAAQWLGIALAVVAAVLLARG